jgi:hypothetical protein
MNELEEFEFRRRYELEQVAKPGESFPEKLGRSVLNAGAGALRGAGSIGATLLTPYDYLFGNTQSIGNPERRKAMDEALQGLGADPKSIAFMGGKLGAEIAGTLPIGGLLAKPIAGVAPRLAQAVESAGFVTGGSPVGFASKAGDLGLRSLGGGVTGAVAAGLVNPEDAGSGGAIGAALPPVLKGVGGVGSAIYGTFKSDGKDIAKALDLMSPVDRAAAIVKLRSAKELVPDSRPTVAQALQSPQSGILQRVVHDSAGGGVLRDQLAAQSVARMKALESVAPVNPLGLASSMSETGEAIGKFAIEGRKNARDATSAIYNSVPQDEALLYGADLASIRDKFYGPGVFTDRGAVDRAVATADKLGSVAVPMVKASKGSDQTLVQAVKAAGGINRNAGSSLDFRGEIKDLMQGNLGRISYANKGKTIDNMADRMHELGFIPDRDPVTLINALRDAPETVAPGGQKTFQSMLDKAMGDAPVAERVPVKMTLKDFEDLRSSIGQEQRAAGMSGNSRSALALGEMKKSLDDRINQVVSGDGKIDEVLPLDWANKLTEGRASKLAEVKRFGTGPQASIFRTGSDGQPLVQGGEITAKFWGARRGLKEDVQSFNRLIEGNPELLGQFRGMITTEGASTAKASGELTSKFPQWFKSHLPGLREAFDKDEVVMLSRIAADIQRAEKAAAAGMSRGSNTYQNAQNALDLGLLDSSLLSYTAGKVPFLSGGLSMMRDSMRANKGRKLATLLSDPAATADALSSVGGAGLLSDPRLVYGYRAFPVLGAD